MREQLVILAGGQGKRMNSDLPKPLIKIAGKTIIENLLERMRPLFPQPVIVIGYKGNLIKESLGSSYIYAEQKEQKGTSDALLAAKEALAGVETVAVMPGDHPLVSLETIRELLNLIREKKTVMTLATLKFQDFENEGKVMARAGRIIRNADGSVNRIVEFKDATEEERKITEINPSYYCFDTKWLWENIGKITPNNAAKEYYLTDLLGIATEQGHKVYSVEVKNPFEGMGVNTPEELAVVENYLKKS
ncbi:MAG: UDP-N-acetylglucosamine pyrophosphorylase [Parcubacteria group bacterium Gr01-1014_19]|nr:MAG: UDP-N-acetylglucosamine pyrophosphorylase [Parcubacteria group bacterium Gr01-1014_19]